MPAAWWPTPDGVTTGPPAAARWSQPAGGLDVVVATRARRYHAVDHPDRDACDRPAVRPVAAGPGRASSPGTPQATSTASTPPAATTRSSSASPPTARGWRLQFGDPAQADRVYADSADPPAASTSPATPRALPGGPNAGDKDGSSCTSTPTGTLLGWTRSAARARTRGWRSLPGPDGSVYVGGVAGQGMPGAQAAGANDGWVARYDGAGELVWLRGVATSANDQVSGLVARADGSVVAVGHTRGALGGASAGDNDVFARAFDARGEVLWTTQTGTATDDRGVTGVAGADGTVLVVGTTYGALGTPVGGAGRVHARARGRRHARGSEPARDARAGRGRRVGRREPVRRAPGSTVRG